MKYFPFFFQIENRQIPIFGGGSEALEKCRRLLPFGPALRVISPKILPAIRELPGVAWEEREFCPEDLDCRPPLVILAESPEKAEPIYRACRERNIPVNGVDMPQFCDVIFPSVAATEHLCVAVSTGGLSPTGAVWFRRRAEELIPSEIDRILEWMGEIRGTVRETLPPRALREALGLLFQRAAEANRPLTPEETGEVLRACQ